MKSLQACQPSSSNFLKPILLNPLASLYKLSTDLLATECVLAKRTFQEHKEDINSVIDVSRQIEPLLAAFPTLKNVLKIALTLAVSTAECERSFSALKRVKTYLRTNNDWEDTHWYCSIERSLSDVISLEDVVDNFRTKRQKQNNHLIMMDILLLILLFSTPT